MKRYLAILMLIGAVFLLAPGCSSQEEEDWWEKQKKAEEEAKLAEAEEPAEKPVEEPPLETAEPKVESGSLVEAEPMPSEPEPTPPPPVEPEPDDQLQPPPNFTTPSDISRAEGVMPGAAGADPNRPVQVAILASPRQPQAGNRVATIMGLYQQERLEKSLGRKVELAYISQSSRRNGPNTRIRYRKGFVKVAIRLAALLPHKQEIRQMNPDEQRETVVDVMIYLGDSVR